MEWLDSMNRALEYLERHMEDTLDMDEVARIALSSKFHFQRMFYMLCGVTVADYLRSRRLTMAAQDLAVGNMKVLDAALKYGYETPEAFTKAFRRFHGVSPSAAREPGITLKSVSRLKFIVSVKGDQDMNYKIEKKEAFRVVGKVLKVSTEDGQNAMYVPNFWARCHEDGTCAALCSISEHNSMLGICANFDPEMKSFDYWVAVVKNQGEIPQGYEALTIPALTCAVFEAVGKLPESVQTVTNKIFSEWFPSSNFEHDNGPELEVYLDGDLSDPNYRCEVWIPVVKKG